MTTLPLPIIIATPKTRGKFSVEIDRHGFERLADSLGLFSAEFMESLERAEQDIRMGRIKKLHSLRNRLWLEKKLQNQ